MDNHSIDVRSVGDTALNLAIDLVFEGQSHATVSHFEHLKISEKIKILGKDVEIATAHPEMFIDEEEGTPTFMFYWHEGDEAQPLTYPHSKDGVYHQVRGWLQTVEFGSEPDIDGSCEKGFRVFTELEGHRIHRPYLVCAIQPNWAIYHK